MWESELVSVSCPLQTGGTVAIRIGFLMIQLMKKISLNQLVCRTYHIFHRVFMGVTGCNRWLDLWNLMKNSSISPCQLVWPLWNSLQEAELRVFTEDKSISFTEEPQHLAGSHQGHLFLVPVQGKSNVSWLPCDFEDSGVTVGKCIIPDSKSLPQYHRVVEVQIIGVMTIFWHLLPTKAYFLIHPNGAVQNFWFPAWRIIPVSK